MPETSFFNTLLWILSNKSSVLNENKIEQFQLYLKLFEAIKKYSSEINSDNAS